jgi:chromosome segregation ATPase
VGSESGAEAVNTAAEPSRPAAAPATGPSKGQDESYWRARARQISSQIESIDKRIQEINDNVANKKTSGIQHGMGATTDYIVLGDYNEELRQLQQKKQKLQQDFSTLEDEARAAGVPPGVLR